jgi:hypothetical protein
MQLKRLRTPDVRMTLKKVIEVRSSHLENIVFSPVKCLLKRNIFKVLFIEEKALAHSNITNKVHTVCFRALAKLNLLMVVRF